MRVIYIMKFGRYRMIYDKAIVSTQEDGQKDGQFETIEFLTSGSYLEPGTGLHAIKPVFGLCKKK